MHTCMDTNIHTYIHAYIYTHVYLSVCMSMYVSISKFPLNKYACHITYVSLQYYCSLHRDPTLLHEQVKKELQLLIIMLLPYMCQ